MGVSDYDEIRNLIARYSHYADDNDPEGYRSVYAKDGELVEHGMPIPADRLPVLVAAYKRLIEEQAQPYGEKHLQMNTAIEVDGDKATAVTDLLMVVLRADSGWSIGGSGRYNDELIKENGHWRIKRRVVTLYKNAPFRLGDEQYSRRLRELMQEVAEPA